jgi:hypothetical protein
LAAFIIDTFGEMQPDPISSSTPRSRLSSVDE